MNIGIIGSGVVARTLATGFVRCGHTVMLGTRNAEKLAEWLEEIRNGEASISGSENISVGSNREAADFGEVIVLATGWEGTMNAIDLAGADAIGPKVLIDVTNPLDVSNGPPPRLAVEYPASGGELIQKALPDAKVVKAFNIVSANIMINPELKEGKPDIFIAGDNDYAKKVTTSIAREFGWEAVHDLGDITNAYWLETFAMLWIYFGFRNNHWSHAFKLLME